MLSIALTNTPAHADTKSLAIIDSYFDSRVSVSQSVCTATTGCNTYLKTIPSSLVSPVNHGDAMVEVAKRQNPGVQIIAIRAANASVTSVNDMNAGDFIQALQWVNNNPGNIGAVSVSRYFNGNTPCTPNSTNTATFGGWQNADNLIRQLIISIKSKGIQIFASAGNTKNAPVDYPACITDTNSVSVGDLNKSNQIVSLFAFDANTDYFVSGSLYNYKSTVFGSIPNTTSSATVATAVKYLSGTLDKKFFNVLQ